MLCTFTFEGNILKWKCKRHPPGAEQDGCGAQKSEPSESCCNPLQYRELSESTSRPVLVLLKSETKSNQALRAFFSHTQHGNNPVTDKRTVVHKIEGFILNVNLHFDNFMNAI